MTAPATSRGAPLGRRQVHAQSWRRVDLDHGAGTHRCRDVAEPDVDAAHVETDRGRGAPAHLGDLGMHLAGHVAARAPGREVGVAPKPDDLAGARHRARRVALLGEVADRHVVDREPGERPGVPLPAPRVGVEAVGECADVVSAVAGHVRGPQLRGGHRLAVHDEHTEIAAGDVGLHDHLGLLGGRLAVGQPRSGAGGHLHRHMLTVVAVTRLDDHGRADRRQRLRGLGGGGDHGTVGHGHAHLGEQPFGQRLVRRDVHTHRRGLFGHRRPDEAPVTAVAESQQALPADPGDRDPAPPRGVGQRGGTDAEPLVLRRRTDRLERRDRACRAPGQGLHDHVHGEPERVGGHP